MRFFNLKTPFATYEVCGELFQVGGLVSLKLDLNTENLVDSILSDGNITLRKETDCYLVSFPASYITYIGMGDESIDQSIWRVV